MNDKEITEILLLRVIELRIAQNSYIKNRNDVNLRKTKQAERQLDELANQLMKRGYDPMRHVVKRTQGNLF